MHEGAGEPSVPSFHGSKCRSAAARPGPEADAWPRPTRPAADHNPRRPGRLEVAPLWWTPVPATLVFAVIACWLVLSGCRVLAACSPAPRVLVLTVALIVTFSGRS
jgi:hypothetical protein